MGPPLFRFVEAARRPVSELIEPVFTAPVRELVAAKAMLAAAGIAARHTSPRRVEGLIRVARSDAERARSLLRAWSKGRRGRPMEASEAALYFCHGCGATLSDGARTCPSCGALVADLHGS